MLPCKSVKCYLDLCWARGARLHAVHLPNQVNTTCKEGVESCFRQEHTRRPSCKHESGPHRTASWIIPMGTCALHERHCINTKTAHQGPDWAPRGAAATPAAVVVLSVQCAFCCQFFCCQCTALKAGQPGPTRKCTAASDMLTPSSNMSCMAQPTCRRYHLEATRCTGDGCAIIP